MAGLPFLIGLWVVSGLLLSLAIVGILNERTEGLKIAWLRPVGSGLAFAFVSLLVFACVVPRAHEIRLSVAPAITGSTQDPWDTQRRELLGQIQGLQAQIDSKNRELNELPRPSGSSPQPTEITKTVVTPPVDASSVTVLALIAIMVAIVCLFITGSIRTLLPSWIPIFGLSAEEQRARTNLERLTLATFTGEYGQGLEIAAQIQAHLLDDVDRLDLLYLRSYCRFQRLGAEGAAESVRDLLEVVDRAPNRGDAFYLLAMSHWHAEEYQLALEAFDRASVLLKDEKLPFDHNKSVCCLLLAEKALREGDTVQTDTMFQRVTRLGALRDSIVHSRIRIGLINFRKAISERNTSGAAEIINNLTGLVRGSKESGSAIKIFQSAFDTKLALREERFEDVLKQSSEFLDKNLPEILPPLDEDIPDEIFSSIADSELSLPRELLGEFLFMQAIAQARITVRASRRLNEAQVGTLAAPLLRALQIDPRQRDLLGSIGGLYYWFRKEQRERAVSWLESAQNQGVEGNLVREILERDRLVEMERRQALDWFRSASARFLRDPHLAQEVRTALIEELGRFQEFEPILIELREKPEIRDDEPTLEILRSRGRYLAQMAADFGKRGSIENQAKINQVQNEYVGLVDRLSDAADRIKVLEKTIFKELANSLAM